jgi:hypothetical protein
MIYQTDFKTYKEAHADGTLVYNDQGDKFAFHEDLYYVYVFRFEGVVFFDCDTKEEAFMMSDIMEDCFDVMEMHNRKCNLEELET